MIGVGSAGPGSWREGLVLLSSDLPGSGTSANRAPDTGMGLGNGASICVSIAWVLSLSTRGFQIP